MEFLLSGDDMASFFSIRMTTSEDDRNLGKLLTASYPALMRASYDPAPLERALPLLTRPQAALISSGTFYLAENDERRLVGCGGWTLERPGSGDLVPGLAHIRHFATHPDWTGHGIGRALFTKCEQEARAAGASEFECNASLNAEGFYAALGFDKVRLFEVSMGPDLMFPSVLMRRSI